MLKVVSGMTGTVAVTDTDLALEPPDPEQFKEKVYEPAGVIVNAVLPEVAFVPDHEPDAEQEVALEVDQARVVVFVKRTDVGSADKLTDAAGVTGAAGAPPPPPPPPPQETIIKVLRVSNNFFTINSNEY